MNEHPRIAKLRQLVTEAGGPAAFVKKYSRKDADKPIDETYVSQILNGHRSFGEKAAYNMENRAGLPEGYFNAQSSVEHGPELRGLVPVISWVQAGDYSEVIDNLHPGDAEEYVETTVPVRRRTFALRVVGDSMEPDFPSGVIIVVEPEMSYSSGDFVVAKDENGQATFKQLIQDGSDWYLKPLNTHSYKTKPIGNSVVVGVIREMIRRFK